MATEKKFKLLRGILRTFGLSEKAVDEVINTIVRLLAGDGKTDDAEKQRKDFPYTLQKHFLSPAELNFFRILRDVVGDKATICTKVSLGDLFTTKKDDYSQYTSYMNKIRRKHVDFLLCDNTTMRPLIGIELDDKSHERQDRQDRDKFVNGVFKASGLPLIHIPVKKAYITSELASQLTPYLNIAVSPAPPVIETKPTPVISDNMKTPKCPKCGSDMILRKAKSGANAGNQFWGCSQFPTCRTMLPYEG
ncbi:MAG: DUF2726 domain-containing protein [Anaerolineae bacterium]|nr:DUF2726 domain-containing protein [Anaerolineae bacterium]